MPPESEPDAACTVVEESNLNPGDEANSNTSDKPSHEETVDESFEYDSSFEDPPLLTVSAPASPCKIYIMYYTIREQCTMHIVQYLFT